MAPDVERLWQAVKGDRNVKMVALTLGSYSSSWINSYREYTGLTMPIFEGAEIAKKFNIGLVPAVVVVSPADNKAYVKTGQQDFVRLYEFVRVAQGLPATITPQLQRLATMPVGVLGGAGKVKVVRSKGHESFVSSSAVTKNSLEKF